MKESGNKIFVVSSGLGDTFVPELELHGGCDNILDYQYAMRDVLHVLNDGSMYSDTYRLTSIQIGGSDYGRLRCHMAVEYFDEKDRRIELYYYGDGMFYAYATLDNGEILRCLFDDHNWKVENSSYIFHDMMAAFEKEFNKHNK